MVFGVYGSCLVMGVVSRFWLMGLMLVIFGVRPAKNANTGVTKIMIFWCYGPVPKCLNIFFKLESMLVKLSENIFWGNPCSANNVHHFANICIWPEFMPQFHEFACCMIQEKDTLINIFHVPGL